MSGKRYPEEFKTEAVKQVVDRGYSFASVATRLDITTHSLYAWIKKYGPDSSTNKEQSDAPAEIRRLQKELKRVTDERDILKKAAVDSSSATVREPVVPSPFLAAVTHCPKVPSGRDNREAPSLIES